MRSSPTLFETKLSLSFFLTTPARKPRTECCCQAVVFMIAAMVVPFGCRSSTRTVSCLDEAGDLATALLEVAALGTASAFPTLRFLDKATPVRARFVALFADFDLDLLVAIWPSLMSTAASC